MINKVLSRLYLPVFLSVSDRFKKYRTHVLQSGKAMALVSFIQQNQIYYKNQCIMEPFLLKRSVTVIMYKICIYTIIKFKKIL